MTKFQRTFWVKAITFVSGRAFLSTFDLSMAQASACAFHAPCNPIEPTCYPMVFCSMPCETSIRCTTENGQGTAFAYHGTFASGLWDNAEPCSGGAQADAYASWRGMCISIAQVLGLLFPLYSLQVPVLGTYGICSNPGNQQKR